MPKLACVFKELNAVNDLKEIFKKEYLEQIQKLNEQHEKSKEIQTCFQFLMFEVELHLIGSGLKAFEYFIKVCHTDFTYKNDSCDIILLFIFKKLFNRIKSEEPEVFKVYIDYVKELKETREESQNECGLAYYDEFVDPGLRKVVDGISKGVNKPSGGVCLSFNQLTQAKFFLRNIILDPDRQRNYICILHMLNEKKKDNKDFELGYGWLMLHLNTFMKQN